jgi:hypothetical protein
MMSVQEFTNKVDGITNDYRDGATSEREFKEAILDLMIEVATPKLQPEPTAEQLPKTSDERPRYASLYGPLSTRRDRKPPENEQPYRRPTTSPN